jgi:hypothetical protein
MPSLFVPVTNSYATEKIPQVESRHQPRRCSSRLATFYKVKPELRTSGSGSGHYNGSRTGTIFHYTACNAVVNLFVLASHEEVYTVSCYRWVWSLGTNAFRHRLIGLLGQSALKRHTFPHVLLPICPEGRGEVSQTAQLNSVAPSRAVLVAGEES